MAEPSSASCLDPNQDFRGEQRREHIGTNTPETRSETRLCDIDKESHLHILHIFWDFGDLASLNNVLVKVMCERSVRGRNVTIAESITVLDHRYELE